MNDDSNNSHSEMKIELEKVQKEIRDKGYDPDRLAVFFLDGKEMIIGEVTPTVYNDNDSDLVGKSREVKNPKRYMRLQQLSQHGIAINTFIGDLDAVENGIIQIIAHAAYWLADIDEKSQIDTLKLLLNYFQQKVKNKAMEAGLTLPNTSLRR